MSGNARIFAVAPMMDWTDRHCRVFHRSLSTHARLYTEMVTSAAIRHGDRRRLLDFDPREQPVALQLGGSAPAELAAAARVGEEWGYTEINLNVGCPSDRVQAGRFGACLMAEPALVANCVAAMRAAVAVPVTVKCRIGIDDQDTEAALDDFVGHIAAAGCETIIVHARKAWLAGLSPRENRDVPPLDYARVYRLKAANPALTVVLNGGITSLDDAERHLRHVDGVMLGRAAYHDPALLAEVDARLFGAAGQRRSSAELALGMLPYIEQQQRCGVPLARITRHMLGLAAGQPGARSFRRILSEDGIKPDAGGHTLRRAVACLEACHANAA